MQLLIIGTLDGQIGAASQAAMSRGAKVSQANDIDGGLAILRGGRGIDLVMIDVKLEVAKLMDSLREERMAVPVVACGIGSDTAAAVRAIKAGAKEYIPLPPNPELIAAVLAAITEEDHRLIFRDPAMEACVRLAEQIAPSDASMLITGPSGTGKEVMARYIHARSRRKDAPFIAVNCAAIPDNLLESELFGHERGAFTGAVARRIGKFEEANNGTLLLDEISEMDPRLQAKLLRVLQERVVDRLGGGQPVKVNVRILATSNRNLQDEVGAGRFREDLFFRLNVVSLALPALGERRQDILPLAEHFVRKFAEANGVTALPLSDEARKLLSEYSWPGNVRELENTIHRAVLLGGPTEIGPTAITLTGGQLAARAAASVAGAALHVAEPAAMGGGPSTGGLVGRTVADVERGLIIDTLRHCLGNRTHAANILGISIRTLRNKLKQYNDEGFSVPPPAGETDRAAV